MHLGKAIFMGLCHWIFSNGMHLKAISKAESSLKSYTRRYSEQFPLGASKPPIVPFVVYIVKGGFIKRHLH